GVPNMASEYGAISKTPDAYDPFWGDLQPEHEQFPWRSGQAIWAGFDYGSIAGKQGLKGILTHQRLPKRSYDWYRDHYTASRPQNPACTCGAPVRLALTADRIIIEGTDATDDALVTVTIVDANGNRVADAVPTRITLAIES